MSQIVLRQQIDGLIEELLKINEALQYPIELDGYVTKLGNAKRKIVVIGNILQKTQESLIEIHQTVEKETNKKKALWDRSAMYRSPASPTASKEDN